jgi:hypothetical protein
MVDLSAKVIKYLEANGKTANEIGLYFENPNVAITDDGTGAIIKIWKEEELGVARPTDAQLDALDAQATTLESNNQVDATRRTAYGSWNDQLDEIYHDIDAWKARLLTIKNSNPKS